MRFKSLTAALAVVTAAVVVSAGSRALGEIAATGALAPNQWAQAASDLPPDPQVRFGRLPNGMTYALKHNATPSGQASVRLRIAAGSLMESDDQQGLAHVLEHMAFNGSTHVPTGEMVKILERHGLAFGADTNASTSHQETVYKLDLPRTDSDTIDTSLMLLREIAGELTLPQDALDKERGVVLSEERLGDNPNYRIYKSRLKFLLPDQLASARLPIGQVDVIRNAPRETLKAFYDKYYRPERATLVVVGDFDLTDMEAKIKSRFSDWANTHPAGGEVDMGAPQPRQDEAKVVVEPGAAMSIQLAWTAPADMRPETRAGDREDIVRDLALAVLNRRLGRLSRQASPPFISAAAGRGAMFDSATVTTIQVMADPDQWSVALAAAEHEQRRLAQYGVLKSELDREIEDYITALRQRVTAASTRRTPALADMFVAAVGQRAVIRDPSQDLAQFQQDEVGVSAQEVSLAARNLFAGAAPIVFMSTPKPIEGGDTALAAAYQAFHAEAISAPKMVADKAWPYEGFGGPGKIVERRNLSEFGAVMVRFANGVRLTVKPTKYRRNETDVQVRFGNGRLDLPKSAPSPIWASSALIEGGLKQLTTEDIDQTLNKKVVGAHFAVDDDAFILSGAAQSTDLDTQLQLLTAYVVEPAFRPEAFERMRVYGQTLNSQYDATASGVLRRDLSQLLHGGDQRWATPSNDVIAASKAADLKALLTRQMDRGPMEVVIVGDVDVKRAIAATGATLGALRRTAAAESPAPDGRLVAFPKAADAPVIERHRGRSDQAMAAAAWPTTDFYADMREARVLTLLSQIIRRRLIDDLRMDKGDTYSPNAALNASQTYPGYGYLLANVEIPPAKVDVFFTELEKIAADLRTQPVSQDELTRAALPLIDQIKQARQSNDYWLGALTGVQTDPRGLQAVRTQLTHYAGVKPADLLAAAKKYLIPNKAWKFEVLPESMFADAAPVGASASTALAAK